MLSILRILERTCIENVSYAALVFVSVAGLSVASSLRVPSCEGSAIVQRINGILAKREYDRAASALDEFRVCPARSPLETFQLGWLYGRARRFDTALKIFNSLPRDVPDRLTHDYATALSQFELAQYQSAIDILKSDQSSGASDAKSINLLAVSYSKLGMYREAYSILAKQIQTASADITSYLNLITVCAEGGDFTRAAETAAEARRLFPNSPDVLVVQGAAEISLGHLERAYDDFGAGVRLAPLRADARFFLALTDYKQGKFHEAVDILQRAAKEGIADSDLHYLTAECLVKLDPANSAAALQELDRAVNLNPNSVSARTLRGKLLLENGQLQPALKDLEFAARRNPDSRAAVYNLARVYRAIARRTEVHALFRQVRAQTTDTLNEFSGRRLNEAMTDPMAQQ